jgi:hypothetical protein
VNLPGMMHVLQGLVLQLLLMVRRLTNHGDNDLHSGPQSQAIRSIQKK